MAIHNQKLNARFRDYRRNAETRGLFFGLTLAQFDAMTQETCVFCGAEDHIGVDRKDSSMGYVDGNCQPCCGFCNKMKSNFGEEAFLQQVARINRFQEAKGN